MKTKLPIRIASGLLLFFALGHSIGHFTRHNTKDPKAQEVLRVMTDRKFDMFGQMRSYDENYTGMSLNLVFTLVAFAVILWILSYQTDHHPHFTRSILIPILICVFGFSITGFLFFFPVPAATCLIASIFLVIALINLNKTASS